MKRYRRVLGRTLLVASLAALSGCGGDDYQPPPPIPQLAITCPPGVEAQSPTGAAVSVAFGSPTSTGGQTPVNLSCNPPSGSLFPGGTTNVTCTATDSRGLSAACTVKVFVRIPPRLLGNARVLAFGDSITSGTLGGGTFTSAAIIGETTSPFAYPIPLEALLRDRYTLQSPAMIVAARPGEYAQEGVDRLPLELARYQPDILLLMEGTNELLFQQAGVDDAAVAIRTMVQQAKAFNVRVLLATVLPQRAGGARGRDLPAAFVPVLNARIREIATAENVPLVDTYAPFAADMSLIGEDDLHPTARGFEVLALTFFEAIKQYGELPQPAVSLRR